MDFTGRKVRSVNAGSTHYDPAVGKWYYMVKVNGKAYVATDYQHSENAAHQAMREEVRRLRRIHLIGGENAHQSNTGHG